MPIGIKIVKLPKELLSIAYLKKKRLNITRVGHWRGVGSRGRRHCFRWEVKEKDRERVLESREFYMSKEEITWITEIWFGIETQRF